jgi:hypothetical protein
MKGNVVGIDHSQFISLVFAVFFVAKLAQTTVVFIVFVET